MWKGHNLNFEYQSPKTSPCCGYLAVPRGWKSIWATCSENTNTELQYGCNFWPFDRMAMKVCYTKLNLRHVERNTIFSIILHLCDALHNNFLLWKSTGGFLDFLCTIFNTASSSAPQILLFRRRMGSNPGLWNGQSDALTTRLDLIHCENHILQAWWGLRKNLQTE